MAEEYTPEQLQEILNRQKRLVQQLELNEIEQEQIFAEAATQGGQTTAAEFNRYERLLENERIAEDALRDSKNEEFEARIDTGQYVPVGTNPTQMPNNRSPDDSPAAAQAQAPVTRSRRQRAQAQRSTENENTVTQQNEVNEAGEFGDIQRDLSVEPEVPTQDEPVNTQSNNRTRAQAQRIQNANADGVSLTSPAAEQVESNRERAQDQRVNLNFPEDVEDPDEDLGTIPIGDIKQAPNPVNQDIDFDDEEDVIDFPAEEREAQINNAALERLKAQSAIQQQREPESPGDWRVKLRLASRSTYFYNLPQSEAGVLWPLNATDGIIFPYTPDIQVVYSAEYNPYHPTHSNYQHYFYKGSRVGEVVISADFTAQDTQEANYLLAVIHFLKSASKMFYGQDPERGSPPPLLFLTGLGQYQFNEAPCVISQFNYVLPPEPNYIRANVQQINASRNTLQNNLRNKTTGTGPSWAGPTVRRALAGLPEGAEPQIPGTVANLNSDDATYVPTKMSMTITLLPVQNRLQVSQDFSLRDYASGNLIKRGYW